MSIRPESIRRSDIQTFRKCPRAYQLRDSFLQTPPMAFGSLIHEMLFDYGKHCLEIDKPSDLGYLRNLFTVNAVNCPDSMRTDFEQFRMWIDSSPALQMTYRDRIFFEHVIKYGELCHCTVDRMKIHPDYISIGDYKTNRRPYIQAEIDNSFQAKFYATMAWINNQGSCSEVEFTFYWLRFNSSSKVTFPWGELEQFKEEVIDPTLLRINEADRTCAYPKQTGSHCALCHAANQCLYGGYVLPDAIHELSDSDLAEYWIHSKAHGKAATAELKTRVEKNGPIEYAGKLIDFHVSEARSYKYDDAKNPLLNILVPPDVIKKELSFSSQAVKRLVKKGMEGVSFTEFEKNHATVKTGATFEIK